MDDVSFAQPCWIDGHPMTARVAIRAVDGGCERKANRAQELADSFGAGISHWPPQTPLAVGGKGCAIAADTLVGLVKSRFGYARSHDKWCAEQFFQIADVGIVSAHDDLHDL